MKFEKRESKGSDAYLKFKDGESKNVILRGELHEFYVKWVSGKSVVVNEKDAEGKSRFTANALIYEGGVFQAKIWEFSLPVYNQLADINSEYPLEKTKIKITRKGVGMDTVYHILPLVTAKDVLTPAILAQIEAVPLNILDSHKTAPAASPSHDAFEDIPF